MNVKARYLEAFRVRYTFKDDKHSISNSSAKGSQGENQYEGVGVFACEGGVIILLLFINR